MRCRGTRRSCRTGWRLLLAHCLAHGRRQFVEVAQNFPDECRYVLEMLGEVYGHDAEARERGLTPEERLRLPSGAQRAGDGRNCTTGWRRSWPSGRRSRTRGWARRSRICCGTGRPLTLFLRQAGRPAGQQPRRKGIEAGGPAPEERLVLSDAERGAGRRPVHEPDSHLPVVRRQLVRLPDRTAAARPGTGGQPGGVDAVELPRDAGRGWSMMNPAWPKRIDCGHG